MTAPPTVIPHLDDVGGSHSANVAMLELAALGSITSGSIMAPPMWFPEVAARAAGGDLDLGLHITLTSESVGSRWRPLSTVEPGSGLLDPAGYMWATVPELRTHAHPEAVAAEIRAQLEHALAAGIDITHLDSHMGAALAPEFVAATVDLAIEYRLPLLLPADLDGYFDVLDVGDVDRDVISAHRTRAAAAGIAVADRFVMPLRHRGSSRHKAMLQRDIAALGKGVTFLSLHCAAPGDIAASHPKDAAWRIGEYAAFSDPDFIEWVGQRPLTITGMRPFRDRIRS